MAEETIVRRLTKKTEVVQAAAEKKKTESNPRLRAAEARIAEREFLEKATKVRKEVVAESAVVSSARNSIIMAFGERTPSEIISSILEKNKDLQQARDAISNISDKVLDNLKVILSAINLLKRDYDITITRGKEFSQLHGIYSELKVQYASALAAVTEYIEYWEFVKANAILPGFFNFRLGKYNKQRISYAINKIFIAEERVAQSLFKGLDILHAKAYGKKG